MKKLEDLKKALDNFRKSLEIDLNTLEPSLRDVVESGLVQKFEMCYELFWKAMKEFLRKQEGLDVASPRRTFKALFQLGILSYEQFEICMEMVESRNLLSHVYRREIVDEVLPKLKIYLELMETILKEVERELKDG